MRELGPMAAYNPEKLIEEVKKRPGLYLTEMHADREEKLALWKEVGAAIYRDWTECNKANAYDRVLQIQRKWRSLRDAYNRELRARKSGVRVNKRVYIYFKKMSFLGGFEGEIGDERIQWLKACNRPDLYMAYKKKHNILEHKYVCSLHFEKDMIMKRKLKSDAVPTLNLEQSSENIFEDLGTSSNVKRNETIGTASVSNEAEIPNIDAAIDFEESPVKIEQEDEEMTAESNDDDDDDESELQVFYKDIKNKNATERTIMISRGVQVNLHKDVISKQQKKASDPLDTQVKESEITLGQFKQACDKFLNLHLSYYVKTQLPQ